MRLRAVEFSRAGRAAFSSGAAAVQVEPSSRPASVVLGLDRLLGWDDAAYVASAAAGSSTPPPV